MGAPPGRAAGMRGDTQVIRPTDEEAVAYVANHFATHDYDMTIMCVAAGPSPEGEECTDVDFVDARQDGPTDKDRMTMTVWYLPSGQLYGEW